MVGTPYKLRDEFEIPIHSDGTDQAYFAGNSLGCSKRTRPAIKEALDQWGERASVAFDGEEAWYRLDERIARSRRASSVVFLLKQA